MDDRIEVPISTRPGAIIHARVKVSGHKPNSARAVPSHYDPLTGLPTRGQVSVLINRAIVDARRSHRTFAFVTFDLDGFRMLRETYGPAVGSAIIKFAASAVGASPNNTLVARQGTDGFILVLTGVVNAADTAVRVQHILNAIAVPSEFSAHRLRISASAGIAMFPDDGEDLETLARKSHVAMKESKVRCPGALRFHSNKLAVLAERRFHLATDLSQAIESDALTLFYQPQFEVASGQACGVEVLARWFRTDGSTVDPCVFIPLAEQTQLIRALGSWVLQKACEIAEPWQTRGTGAITLCINVSPYQLDEAFPGAIQQVLKRTGFPAGQLELEITESALIGNTDAIIQCFRQLKLIGVRIAIDDFGTGYSGLSYLSRLPVDRLKLDKSLIHNVTTSWKDAAILRSVIRLGKALGVAVIAEGVETEQQFQMLKQLGCPQVQGYLLARPAAHDEAKEQLARRWGNRHFGPRLTVCAPLGIRNAS